MTPNGPIAVLPNALAIDDNVTISAREGWVGVLKQIEKGHARIAYFEAGPSRGFVG